MIEKPAIQIKYFEVKWDAIIFQQNISLDFLFILSLGQLYSTGSIRVNVLLKWNKVTKYIVLNIPSGEKHIFILIPIIFICCYQYLL